MAIVFDEQNRLFYLHTQNTSYIMQIHSGGHIMHAYWGKRLEQFHVDGTNGYKQYTNPTTVDLPETNQTTDTLCREYPTFGSGDLRRPAFHAEFADGSRMTELLYDSHRIFAGKTPLEGLPATYGKDTEVDTLEITLKDALQGLEVVLSYAVFEKEDAIARSVKVKNNSQNPITLLKVASANVDFTEFPAEMLHLDGMWARERHIHRQPVTYSDQSVNSALGCSGHYHNPFFALVSENATETCGDVYGFSLVYSGNFDGSVIENSQSVIRATMGINEFDFKWKLDAGESFQAPEAVLVYSADGLGQMSRQYHRLFRDHLCRGKFQYADRPVLVNNWEATYFDFNTDKLLAIAEKAKALDIDMLVLDDGWFGKRNDDCSSLGDWVCNTEKLQGGLKYLGDKLHEMGLKFGLWFEPEMVSPISDLYREHPDWCIHINGRARRENRHQLVLDLSRTDVQDYVIEAVCSVLKSAPINYVKWDMNRYFSEIGSDCLDADRQQELPHRYMLGLYRVMEAITSAFPDVLFEGCASGGGRFDPGILYYMPQIWCSDDTDAVERLYIQYGTSVVYPPIAMGAHVSACPNHQVRRNTPFEMRGNVAMSGQFGYELDLSKLSDDDFACAKKQVAFYKEHRHTVQHGDMYRLCDPFKEPFCSWEFVGKDGNEVLVCAFAIQGAPVVPSKIIKLQGLEPLAVYKDEATGKTYSGQYLMQVGLFYERTVDYVSSVTVLKKEI